MSELDAIVVLLDLRIKFNFKLCNIKLISSCLYRALESVIQTRVSTNTNLFVYMYTLMSIGNMENRNI